MQGKKEVPRAVAERNTGVLSVTGQLKDHSSYAVSAQTGNW
ncbi:unnamed protein product, partial [marine sediment metagenome]